MAEHQVVTDHQRTEAIISHLALLGGSLCLDFCNTAEYRETDHPVDLMVSYRALVLWSEHVKTLRREEANQLLQTFHNAEKVLDDALALRQAIYKVFVAYIRGWVIPGDSLEFLNLRIRAASAHRALVPAESGGFAWQWRDYELPGHMLLPVALSAAELLSSPTLDRVRQCPGCGWLFLDQSKNRNRTWCNMRLCGNRAKARRHYQRQKSTPHASS